MLQENIPSTLARINTDTICTYSNQSESTINEKAP
jgi:hypothetical protein